MSAAKYIPYALVAGGLYALWRMTKGLEASIPAASPMQGVGTYNPVISGLGHGHGGGGGHHHGGGFRGGWGGGYGYGPGWAYEADAGNVVADAFYDASGNLVVGLPVDPKAKRVKVLLSSGGQIIRALSGMGEYVELPNYDGSAPKGLHGLRGSAELGELGFSFKKVISQATGAAKEVAKIAATPVHMMTAPPLALVKAVKTGSFNQGVQVLRKAVPLSAKAYTPNLKVMLGKGQPVTRAGTPAAVTGPGGQTAGDVAWSAVAGRPGWEIAPGEGGTIVFRNMSKNALFSATPDDMNSLGGPTGVIDYWLSLQGQSATQPPPPVVSDPAYNAPQTPESPGVWQGTQSGGGGGGGGGGDGGYPTAPTSSTPADTATPDQQYVAPDAAPATGQSISPLAVIGTLVAVPALFMLGGGHK